MTDRPRLHITHKLVQALVSPPEDEFEVIQWDNYPSGIDALLRREGKGCEVLLCHGMEDLNAERLALLPDLKLITVIAAGMAGIDFDYVRANDIAVTNAGDLNSSDVADYAMALFLAHRRDLIAHDRYVRDDKWPIARMPIGRSIGDERVGLVGLGNIGRAIAQRVEPFGCEIAWWGPNPKPDSPWERHASIEELATWSSTLIVGVAGIPATIGLIGRSVIDAVGPDGLIVNVSRGFVIDEPAMIAALKDGRLGGAALDVFEDEPITGSAWASVPNVIMAPHVAGATDAALRRVTRSSLANIRAFFAGEPLRHRAI